MIERLNISKNYIPYVNTRFFNMIQMDMVVSFF
jgi:hypothetical protein